MRCVFLAALAVGGGCAADTHPAEMVLRGGHVYTVDPERPVAEAVATSDGRIVFVGSDADAAAWIGPNTEVVELAGRMLLPGFHDTHVHPVSGGIELGECDLNPATSVAEVRQIITGCVTQDPAAPWLRGGGFQLPLFDDGAPSRRLLDELVPDRPAFFTSSDAHTGWANSAALAAAGISRETPDPPPDGVIVRERSGAPQGTLRESAMALVQRHLPPHTPEEVRAGLQRGLELAASFGITTLHEANADEIALAAYRLAADEGLLSARMVVAMSVRPEAGVEQVARLEAQRERYRSTRLLPVAAKIFLDGVIEGGTAALLEPYVDRPASRGELVWQPAAFATMVAALDDAGFKVHVHAIGDRAIRVALDGFEAQRGRDGGAGPRHIITHLQLFDPADIPRLAELGVVASFQPLWAYADTFITELTEPRLGAERSRWLYPLQSVVETKAIVAAGSDWSVSTMNPLPAIEVAITRRDPDADAGPGWIPQEQVSLETILRAYTMGGAMAGDLEAETGSITPGKSADLVVLDRNLFDIPVQEISRVRVDMTMFGGRVVFRRPVID